MRIAFLILFFQCCFLLRSQTANGPVAAGRTAQENKLPENQLSITKEKLLASKSIWDIIPGLPHPIPSQSCQVIYTNEGKQVKMITLTNYENIHDPYPMKYARSFRFAFSPGLPTEKRVYAVTVK